MRSWLAGLALLLLAGCADGEHPAALPPGATYVAMGSSFGSGPGLPPMQDGAPARCMRSARNYASLVARKLGLRLIDATCAGATTTNVLAGWSELPPQIAAVTADTRLVTVTIGGNDVNYVRNLMAATCQPGARCIPRGEADEKAWAQDEANMRAIVRGVRSRAPQARILLVDYFSLLPDAGSCPAVAMAPADLEAARLAAGRLQMMTATVAQEEGAELVLLSQASRDHTACDRAPWTVGAAVTDPAAGGIAWHPDYAGMQGAADAVVAALALAPPAR